MIAGSSWWDSGGSQAAFIVFGALISMFGSWVVGSALAARDSARQDERDAEARVREKARDDEGRKREDERDRIASLRQEQRDRRAFERELERDRRAFVRETLKLVLDQFQTLLTVQLEVLDPLVGASPSQRLVGPPAALVEVSARNRLLECCQQLSALARRVSAAGDPELEQVVDVMVSAAPKVLSYASWDDLDRDAWATDVSNPTNLTAYAIGQVTKSLVRTYDTSESPPNVE